MTTPVVVNLTYDYSEGHPIPNNKTFDILDPDFVNWMGEQYNATNPDIKVNDDDYATVVDALDSAVFKTGEFETLESEDSIATRIKFDAEPAFQELNKTMQAMRENSYAIHSTSHMVSSIDDYIADTVEETGVSAANLKAKLEKDTYYLNENEGFGWTLGPNNTYMVETRNFVDPYAEGTMFLVNRDDVDAIRKDTAQRYDGEHTVADVLAPTVNAHAGNQLISDRWVHFDANGTMLINKSIMEDNVNRNYERRVALEQSPHIDLHLPDTSGIEDTKSENTAEFS